MNCASFTIRPARPDDYSLISALHSEASGPGRFARTAYRVRESCAPDAALCLTAWNGRDLAGAVHFTPIIIGGAGGALLLGPLAIAPRYKGQGWGSTLMRDGLAKAKMAGYKIVILVGDLAYYQKAGFETVPAGQIRLPGPVDPGRLLAAELVPGSLTHYRGLVSGGYRLTAAES